MIYYLIYVDLYECINQTTQAGYQMQIIHFSFIYIEKTCRGVNKSHKYYIIMHVVL